MTYDPDHQYDPSNPGEGIIPLADQYRIAATGAYLLATVFLGFTAFLFGVAAFVVFYCHSAFGLLMLAPGIPMAWATIQGYIVAGQISRGED